MFDFGALPPEINSARMYTGPGAGPMMAAAAAWDGLTAQLEMFAARYSALVSELQGESWSGASSAAMAAASAPYVAWVTTTAQQSEQTANQARAAAAAYEAAFVATVPPTVVAANRALLTTLVASNFFGQNTPAIAATEAAYAEMWAQDAAAMYNYAGSAASAASLTQFSQPPPTTSSTGQSAQDAAVSQAVGSSADQSQTALSQLLSALPQQLQGLASGGVTNASCSGGVGVLDHHSVQRHQYPYRAADSGLSVSLRGLPDGHLHPGSYAVRIAGEVSARDDGAAGERRLSLPNNCTAGYFAASTCQRGPCGADRRIVHPAELGGARRHKQARPLSRRRL